MTRRQFFVALVVLFVGGVIGSGLSAWLLPGRAAWAQRSAATVKEVRAERFALVDATGRGHAALEIMEEGDPALRLFDEAGKARMVLRMEYGQPSFELCDEDGQMRALLCLAPDTPRGNPELWLVDTWDVGKVLLSSCRGEPEMRFFGVGGLRTYFGLYEGEPTLTLYGSRSKWEAP
jgi:hypothetical protein